MSEVFTFRGTEYKLTRREQMVHVSGPWKGGTKLFTRRCRGKTTASSIDETAADMLVRVEFDAAKYEFTLRPICALSACTARSYHPCSRAERQGAPHSPRLLFGSCGCHTRFQSRRCSSAGCVLSAARFSAHSSWTHSVASREKQMGGRYGFASRYA